MHVCTEKRSIHANPTIYRCHVERITVRKLEDQNLNAPEVLSITATSIVTTFLATESSHQHSTLLFLETS